MLGSARQLRSRSRKISDSKTSVESDAAPNRTVFGDVSNRSPNQANEKRKTKGMRILPQLPPSKVRTSRSKNASMPKHAVTRILSHIGAAAIPNGKSKRAAKDAEPPCADVSVEALEKVDLKKTSLNAADACSKDPLESSRSEKDPDTRRRTRSSSRKARESSESIKEALIHSKRSHRLGSVELREPACKRARRVDVEERASTSSNCRTDEMLRTSPLNSARSIAMVNKKSEPKELCRDFHADSNFTMVRSVYDSSKYNAGISNHDIEYKDDPSEVVDYVTDLYQHFYHAEMTCRPRMYMIDQSEINQMMRAILVDWIVEVHMKFKLVPETLYLSISIIDRYCSRVKVERRQLQLVGVTALLLACKYEEIYPPEVRDCVYITDRAYTRQDVLDMEQKIVKILEFKLTIPTGYPFLVRFLRVTNASELAGAAAKYYLESTLQDYEFLQYRPSLVASASVYLALNNPQAHKRANEQITGSPDQLLEYTGYTEGEIVPIACKIVEKLGADSVTASQRALLAVKKKYAVSKYFHVSCDVIIPQAIHREL